MSQIRKFSPLMLAALLLAILLIPATAQADDSQGLISPGACSWEQVLAKIQNKKVGLWGTNLLVHKDVFNLVTNSNPSAPYYPACGEDVSKASNKQLNSWFGHKQYFADKASWAFQPVPGSSDWFVVDLGQTYLDLEFNVVQIDRDDQTGIRWAQAQKRDGARGWNVVSRCCNPDKSMGRAFRAEQVCNGVPNLAAGK